MNDKSRVFGRGWIAQDLNPPAILAANTSPRYCAAAGFFYNGIQIFMLHRKTTIELGLDSHGFTTRAWRRIMPPSPGSVMLPFQDSR
jgi:hypothetical protein